MTLSPHGYANGPPPPPIGGIQDETPLGAGMLDSSQQHYQPPNASYPADSSKKTFTFTRKTVIIIAVVVVVVIGALVGGLVGGLKSKNSGNSSPDTAAQTSDSSNTGASTPARTSSFGDTSTATTRGPDATTTSENRPTSTGTVSEIDTLRGTGGSENAYPTTATYSIIGASGISGISPTPFPGFDETISSSSLLTNGDFKSDDFDGWSNDDGCWQVQTDPSTAGFSPLEESTTGNNLIARNTADDLSGGKSCNLTQVVTGLRPGTLELSFLWGHYQRDEDTWFYVSAGSTGRPLVILAMQDTPGFSRTVEWTKSAYSIEFEGGDFVVTFSAHSQVTAHDVAQVQLIRK
ncbi:uncharacterized protein DFL_008279 [Arthrobotrys flagrans]|uniref:Uncharacterized protein n=1 Tax=Arthrobotrys flagrans TaxID=97331 RepID=A0A436ZNK5_ARTFL|nr:hypothetical protein DFL_008279 [Arthrobotrys flagrans]